MGVPYFVRMDMIDIGDSRLVDVGVTEQPFRKVMVQHRPVKGEKDRMDCGQTDCHHADPSKRCTHRFHLNCSSDGCQHFDLVLQLLI
jgi:uncharacterized Zn-binding protein involved in type VI secretion